MFRLLQKYFLIVLPFLFIFIASIYRPYDADLGWHLKYGEHFVKTGQILKENTFSTEMSDYIWPNTSWGTDILTYLFYSGGGFLGVSILGAIVITLTFFIYSKAFKLTFFEQAIVFPLIVLFENPVNQVSFRGQLLSLLFLGVLLFLLTRFEEGKKKLIFLSVPLFLLWANMHGQYILGLGIFALWILFYLAKKLWTDNFAFKNFFSKNLTGIKLLLAGYLGSLIATLIHPFGIEIYTVALRHFSNPDLKFIMEYLPFEDLSQPWWNQMIVAIIFLFGIISLFFNEQFKEKLPYVGITTLLYALSWWVRRYAWAMYYTAFPLIQPVANFLKPDSEKNTKIAATLLFIFYIGIVLMFKYPFTQFTSMNWDTYCNDYLNCSAKSVEFIRDNKLTKDLLTFYNWGGYMIWQYPEVKPSIDGRMHLWVDDKGYSAFDYYYPFEQNSDDVDKSKYKVVLISPEKPLYDRLIKLSQLKKWKMVYQDEKAAVFVRNIAEYEAIPAL